MPEAPPPEAPASAAPEQTSALAAASALASSALAEVAAAQGSTGSAQRFKVSLPPSADIVLEVTRKDADGALWHGAGALAWRLEGPRYRMVLEASVRIIVRLNLLELTSAGRIDEAGLAPESSTEKRRGRARTATHFDYAGKRITFSAAERSEALVEGAQDKLSLLMQLAGIARADPQQLAREIDIQVGEEREATVFRFSFVGEEELDTALGKLRTWHLVRLPRPGAYNARLDIWLAPDRDGYPVQIRNTEANGAVTTQTVTKVTTSEAGQP
ncbi:DUF3108 domain-containing protein [Massilia sp. TS11]|nr:DUF3108 domain-containing protein [Massilia sp. TS11]